jgi:hypothetical protein
MCKNYCVKIYTEKSEPIFQKKLLIVPPGETNIAPSSPLLKKIREDSHFFDLPDSEFKKFILTIRGGGEPKIFSLTRIIKERILRMVTGFVARFA